MFGVRKFFKSVLGREARDTWRGRSVRSRLDKASNKITYQNDTYGAFSVCKAAYEVAKRIQDKDLRGESIRAVFCQASMIHEKFKAKPAELSKLIDEVEVELGRLSPDDYKNTQEYRTEQTSLREEIESYGADKALSAKKILASEFFKKTIITFAEENDIKLPTDDFATHLRQYRTAPTTVSGAAAVPSQAG
jgi:hypothetical protein